MVFHQPIWKICSSKWVHLPQVRVKIKDVSNHQPDINNNSTNISNNIRNFSFKWLYVRNFPNPKKKWRRFCKRSDAACQRLSRKGPTKMNSSYILRIYTSGLWETKDQKTIRIIISSQPIPPKVPPPNRELNEAPTKRAKLVGCYQPLAKDFFLKQPGSVTK